MSADGRSSKKREDYREASKNGLDQSGLILRESNREDLDSAVMASAEEFDERHGTVWRDGFYYQPI